jgi:hypothetical protein
MADEQPVEADRDGLGVLDRLHGREDRDFDPQVRQLCGRHGWEAGIGHGRRSGTMRYRVRQGAYGLDEADTAPQFALAGDGHEGGAGSLKRRVGGQRAAGAGAPHPLADGLARQREEGLSLRIGEDGRYRAHAASQYSPRGRRMQSVPA